ncbi:protoporphyrinogen oxidase [Motilibacter aurantiacus]|uniref:protoporphyrinogen oxidase n=1 Tax=Motilibacter aurantiacus TaxID=2714955 RepID=UPI00140908AC|nr:protoporphyrinogen oxidase [Motilibacter aurantiacus]NHC46121.1 protoporphyrinogen oxidase [Motilibacter aurantiacus]
MHVVVVGAGIAGLTAALDLLDGDPAPRVTVLEGASRVGGPLSVSEVAGVPVDAGAESLLARRPEALDLAHRVGLGADLRPAATTAAAVWSRGALRGLPAGSLMGVPTSVGSLAQSGLLSAEEVERAALDESMPGEPPQEDVAIGRYVADRMGAAVADRVVEPLLGGVYAGHAAELSLQATVPALAAAVGAEPSLMAAARRARDAAPSRTGPVFEAPVGGVGRLPLAVADAVVRRGGDLRLQAPARQLHRTPHGWRVVAGDPRSPSTFDADAVVLTVPAAPAARLLGPDVPAAAAELAAVEYASVGLVTLAWPLEAAGRAPQGSGLLVPPVEGRLVKAVTLSSRKWGWYADAAPGLLLARASVGRHREEAVLQRDDAELAAAVRAELRELIGVDAEPVDTRVTRWGGALPQYAVGHLRRVARIRAAVAGQPGLAVAGAVYDGVGIPAVVASARRAAAQVLAHLADAERPPREEE